MGGAVNLTTRLCFLILFQSFRSYVGLAKQRLADLISSYCLRKTRQRALPYPWHQEMPRQGDLVALGIPLFCVRFSNSVGVANSQALPTDIGMDQRRVDVDNLTFR